MHAVSNGESNSGTGVTVSAFDAKKFLSEQFEARTGTIPLPNLRDWYNNIEDDEVPKWTVRGLTAVELARCEEAATKGRGSVKALLETLRKANRVEGIDEIERSLGVDEKIPLKLAMKLEHVVTGVVEPELTLQLAVKFAAVFPIEFEIVHIKINELTGNGQEAVKKAKPSGSEPTSEQP